MLRKASVGRGFRKGDSRLRKTRVFRERLSSFHKKCSRTFFVTFSFDVILSNRPLQTMGSVFFHSCLRETPRLESAQDSAECQKRRKRVDDRKGLRQLQSHANTTEPFLHGHVAKQYARGRPQHQTPGTIVPGVSRFLYSIFPTPLSSASFSHTFSHLRAYKPYAQTPSRPALPHHKQNLP